MRYTELLLYRDFEEKKLFEDMAYLMAHYTDPTVGNPAAADQKRSAIFELLSELFKFAGHYGYHGNLWHCYLTHLLVNHENSYSCGCERRGAIEGSVNAIALHDLEIFREYFLFDFQDMMGKLVCPEFSMALDYESSPGENKVYNSRIRDQICKLAVALGNAASTADMKNILTQFYGQYGVGKFGLHKSFRVVHTDQGVSIEPILNIAHVKMDDIIGYEMAKKKLIDNTEAFVAGRRANNTLLFGDAGTGKSSSIKAIANEYYDKGLRIIEIYKHQFQDLSQVIAQIKQRGYRFIIYMDDLSFEDFEIEYKYLKAVIEGGLEKKPENVLIYATSNRRHLIRENSSDRDEIREDMHTGDTVQEKLSLSYRFGVTIYFGRPNKLEFQSIVRGIAAREGIDMPEEELFLEANKWELSHGGLSGRTAAQFVDYLLGQKKDNE